MSLVSSSGQGHAAFIRQQKGKTMEFIPIDQQQLEEQVRMAHAEAHNEMDRIRNLIAESDLDTTRALGDMLDDIINASLKINQELPPKAAYYQGQVHLVLKTKFSVCQCGRDHAQEMLDSLGVPTPQSVTEEPRKNINLRPEVKATLDDGPDPRWSAEMSHEEMEAGILANRVREIEAERQAYLAQLSQYRVREAVVSDEDMPGAVYCIDCGMRYPSLADRKLRLPDDCHGCQQKAAFG